MVWIETDNEHQSSFSKPWMDDKIVWSSNNTANVANDVAERLVEERDDIHYLNGEPSTDADADLDESDSEDDAETETQTEDG